MNESPLDQSDMPRPLTVPTSTPFGAVIRVSVQAVANPVRGLTSLLSSTISVSMPAPPTTTTGPRPFGASRPGREIPRMLLSWPAPMLITLLPLPSSTRTGTVAAVLATLKWSFAALPWTSTDSTVPSAAGASYLTCCDGAPPQSALQIWLLVTKIEFEPVLLLTTIRLARY